VQRGCAHRANGQLCRSLLILPHFTPACTPHLAGACRRAWASASSTCAPCQVGRAGQRCRRAWTFLSAENMTLPLSPSPAAAEYVALLEELHKIHTAKGERPCPRALPVLRKCCAALVMVLLSLASSRIMSCCHDCTCLAVQAC